MNITFINAGELIGIGIRVKETLGNGLDAEWVDLVLAARDMGIAAVEIREFISKYQAFCNDEAYLQFIQKRRELNY